tara:strand:- start:70 stop:237 length:168 start_codon:yes stop_codon:yes gene_type:complete
MSPLSEIVAVFDLTRDHRRLLDSPQLHSFGCLRVFIFVAGNPRATAQKNFKAAEV